MHFCFTIFASKDFAVITVTCYWKSLSVCVLCSSGSYTAKTFFSVQIAQYYKTYWLSLVSETRRPCIQWLGHTSSLYTIQPQHNLFDPKPRWSSHEVLTTLLGKIVPFRIQSYSLWQENYALISSVSLVRRAPTIRCINVSLPVPLQAD